jgi:hypothetical protein
MTKLKTDPRLAELRARIADTVAGAHWQKSRFLSAIQRRFLRIIEKIDLTISGQGPEAGPVNHGQKILVYIPLFHRRGLSLSDWEGVMLSFESIAPTRQVFVDEKLVLSHIGHGIDRCQNAYVELAVTDDLFLTASSTISQTIFQSRAVVLKTEAFNTLNVRRFIHMGQSYSWMDGSLHKIIDQ